jgi:hypothetical protein
MIPVWNDFARVEGLKLLPESLINRFITETWLTAEERTAFRAEREFFRTYRNKLPVDIVSSDPDKNLYLRLQGSWLIEYLMYDNAVRNLLFDNLETAVTAGISVTSDQIQGRFNDLRADQMQTFTQNPAEYKRQLSAGDLLLFNLDVRQFYVKHILIPFTPEQVTAINNFRTGGKHSQEEVDAFIRNEAMNITAYERRNGYEVVGGRRTVQEIYAEVVATMRGTEGNSFLAEQKFRELIFKYNTDSGMFRDDGIKGYLMGRDEVLGMNMVDSFTEAARDLYDYYIEGLALGQNRIGAISGMVINDQDPSRGGVHIIMLSSVGIGNTGSVALNDYTTVMRDQTFFDAIRGDLLDELRQEAYDIYRLTLLDILRRDDNREITTFPGRWADLIREFNR